MPSIARPRAAAQADRRGPRRRGAGPLRFVAGLLAAAAIAFGAPAARAEPGFVGMHIQGMSELIADALGLDEVKGVLVRDIALGGPAAEAGFERGDLIVSFDGTEVTDFDTLVKLVQKTKPGGSYAVEVLRLGERVPLTLRAGMWTRAWQVSKTSVAVIPEHGLTMASLTPKLREGFDIRWGMTGVVVTLVDPEHQTKVDLQRGELIVQVNQRSVWEPAQVLDLFRKAKADGRKSVMMLIDGVGGFRFIYLTTNVTE